MAKKMEYNYLTEEESKMPDEMVDLQVVLGLQSCKTKKDVRELLQDIRTREKIKVKGILNDLAYQVYRLWHEDKKPKKVDYPESFINKYAKLLENKIIKELELE